MYSSLHNHTEYSLLDGFGHPIEYLERAKEIGLKAFAITEHGNAYSWCYFDELQTKFPEIKLIYGVEFYECWDHTIKDKDSKYFHLIALAKNERGRIALNEIITKSNFEGFYYKPRVDLEMLKPYANDLVISSACLASKLARESDFERCVEYALEYRNAFPYFFLEMQSHDTLDQAEYNQKILALHKRTGIPFIITTDSHAAREGDLEYQGYHVRIARDKETSAEIYSGCYLQSETEIHAIMDAQIGYENVCIGLDNTNAIANMIDEVHMPWSDPKLPTFPLPDGYSSNYELLCDLCKQGWHTRGIDKKPIGVQVKYKERMNYELEVISAMGFPGYFLIVWDYVKYAKDNHIIVGDGRGSGGGSLVVFLLGITELDPIENSLIFERFLNPERVSYPDIDEDFADRASIISYLSKRYGEQHVCQILNISYITPNVSIKDVGRVLGIPYSITDKISSKFTAESFQECIANNQELVDKYSDCSDLFRIASKISGRVRNVSMHAGGVCVFDDNVTDYMPMKLGSDNEHVIQVDKKIIERIGGVKFDILGVRTLKVVQDAADMAGLKPEDLSINNPAFANDTAMYKLLCSAQTNGIFQTESQGMKDLLVRLQPSSLDDVSAVLALYRPDSMPMLDEFIENKVSNKRPHYIHEDMAEILDGTYGCMIYQEQLMDIVRKFGGRSYGGADKFRKGIGKKDKELIKSESQKLYKEILNNDYDKNVAQTISDTLAQKGGYLFNKCLSGKTKIKRSSSGGRAKFEPTIEEMFLIKNDKEYAIQTGHEALWKKYNSKKGYGTSLSLGKDNRVHSNSIVDIYYSGQRELFRLTTESGAWIECTDNHRFPTTSGKKMLSELSVGDYILEIGEYEKCTKKYNLTNLPRSTNLPIKGQIGFQKQDYSATNNFEQTKKQKRIENCPCEICGKQYDDSIRFELHHKDFNRTNNEIDNFTWCCVSCHKKLHYQNNRTKRYEKGIPFAQSKIVSIVPIGIDNVYDVEMAAPNHNFTVSTGIITCNSHSALYSILTLKTAYLKAHYPTEFFCAILNQNLTDFGAINKYILDAKQFDVSVLPPHINRSSEGFSIYNGKILFGLSAIKGIGKNVVNAILSERSNSKFNGFEDLLSRVSLTSAQVVALIKSGAIPTKNKSTLLQRYFEMTTPEPLPFKPVKTLPTKAKLLMDYNIDADVVKDKEERLALLNAFKQREYENKKKLDRQKRIDEFKNKYMVDPEFWEFETLSVFLTNNPFAEVLPYVSLSFADTGDDEKCTVIGVVSGIQKKKDRNKNTYAFINMNSLDGFLELTCWSSQYKQYSDLLLRGKQIAVLVKKNQDKAIVEQVKPYSQWLEDRKIKRKKAGG